MRIAASPLRVLVIVALSLLAAGCATPPPKPAFVAYGSAGTFGYSDTRLSDDLYQVTYVTPYIRTATDEAGRAVHRLASQSELECCANGCGDLGRRRFRMGVEQLEEFAEID